MTVIVLPERTPLPPLVQRYPDCPICDSEVPWDDGLMYCEKCGETWPDQAGEPGQANPDVEQCASEVAPYLDQEKYASIAHFRYRCVRDVGHPAEKWPDEHIGVRSDGQVDNSGLLHSWRDGQHQQWSPTEPAVQV